MRSLSWFVVGIGLVVAPVNGFAQDTPRPAVQVVIGADGSVKVIDSQTGKEIPSKVTRVDRPLDGRKPDDAQRQQADKQRELARQQLEKLPRDQQKNVKPESKRPDGKPIEIELELRGIHIERAPKPGQPASMEQKIDLLLKQMAELRGDVNQLKNKLDGRNAPGWSVGPRTGDGKDKKPGEFRFEIVPGGADKKPELPRLQFKLQSGGGGAFDVDADTHKQILDLIKKLEAKKSADNPQRTPPANRSAELEQRLERLLREVEDLRREILKSKGSR